MYRRPPAPMGNSMQFENLNAGRGALTAVRTGAGPDIVLLHSLLSDRHAFDQVLPALASRHRVTLINLPGFHGSAPTPLALMDAYVAAIQDGFQEFGVGNDSILIGNGFGGTIALAFAIAAGKVAEAGLGSIAEIVAKRVFSPAYLAAHPEAIEERKAVLLQIHPQAFQAACKILQEIDLQPLLHRMKVPTLVVCSEFDQATPPTLNKVVADKVAGARYLQLPGCGHCPALEQPQAFINAIKDFVGL